MNSAMFLDDKDRPTEIVAIMNWNHFKLTGLACIVVATAGAAGAQTPQVPSDSAAIVQPIQIASITGSAMPSVPVADKAPIVYQWHAGNSGHKRLLFEEPRLEHRGISRLPPIQLAQSSAAFFSRSILLPLGFALGVHRQEAHPQSP